MQCTCACATVSGWGDLSLPSSEFLLSLLYSRPFPLPFPCVQTPDSRGCMLELSWKGEKPIPMEGGGDSRVFLKDGDAVIMRGWCEDAATGAKISFGSCEGRVLPAKPLA